MPLTYTNFRGELYYLHSRKTQKGNVTYHFSKKSNGDVVENMPGGYETYETPNGKVYLRKPLKKLIRDEEIKIIANGMEKYCPINDYKLDIKKDVVYIYTNSSPLETVEEELTPYTYALNLDKYKEYETVMRFRLIDANNRTFMVERYCFKGTIDDWIDLEESSDLQDLVKEYVQHIGEETFYELF